MRHQALVGHRARRGERDQRRQVAEDAGYEAAGGRAEPARPGRIVHRPARRSRSTRPRWMWTPLPTPMPATIGAKVTFTPIRRATARATSRRSTAWSAALEAGAWRDADLVLAEAVFGLDQLDLDPGLIEGARRSARRNGGRTETSAEPNPPPPGCAAPSAIVELVLEARPAG